MTDSRKRPAEMMGLEENKKAKMEDMKIFYIYYIISGALYQAWRYSKFRLIH